MFPSGDALIFVDGDVWTARGDSWANKAKCHVALALPGLAESSLAVSGGGFLAASRPAGAPAILQAARPQSFATLSFRSFASLLLPLLSFLGWTGTELGASGWVFPRSGAALLPGQAHVM